MTIKENIIYLKINLLIGPKISFTYHYKIKNKNETPAEGDIVKINIKNRETWALIESIEHKPSFDTKEILDFFKISIDYRSFIDSLSKYYILEKTILNKKILSLFQNNKKNNLINIDNIKEFEYKKNINLNNEQIEAIEKIKKHINNKETKTKPILLNGITGSGKTIVYLKIIEEIINQNKSVVCILPDMTLSENISNELKSILDSKINIFNYNSATPPKERALVWDFLTTNRSFVLLGVHLPVFLPIKNVGLYIIDEEHDTGFQEKNFPYINSKEALLLKANIEKVPIILSSATPSAISWHLCNENKYILINLSKRFFDISLPKVFNVNLSSTKNNNYFWISDLLKIEIEKTLSEKGQILLFLNKKGLYSFARCTGCKYIFNCTSCSNWLTVYDHNILKCNRCLKKSTLSEKCIKCLSDKYKIEKVGVGTLQIKDKIQKLFPTAIIEQADLDSIKSKKIWHETVLRMKNKEIDILIGTQLIARGYHFGNVKLVGLIWADMNLGIPHFANCEQTIQNIIQVSGRAGREENNGKVIIQTIGENIIYNFIEESNYKYFLKEELIIRKKLLHPPFIRLSLIILKHINENILLNFSNKFYEDIKKYENLNIYEPQKAPYYKIKNIYSIFIYIKSTKYSFIEQALKEVLSINKNNNIKFIYIPNPTNCFYN